MQTTFTPYQYSLYVKEAAKQSSNVLESQELILEHSQALALAGNSNSAPVPPNDCGFVPAPEAQDKE